MEEIQGRADDANLDRQARDSSVEKLPRENSNDKYPMWIGDKIYFLSDRNGPVRLFSYDTKAKRIDQLLNGDGLDFKYASAGPGVIALEQFGSIQLYDIKSKKAQPVDIRLNSDLLAVRPRFERWEIASSMPDSRRAVRVPYSKREAKSFLFRQTKVTRAI